MFSQSLAPFFPDLRLFIVLFERVENAEEVERYVKSGIPDVSRNSSCKNEYTHDFHVFLNPHRVRIS